MSSHGVSGNDTSPIKEAKGPNWLRWQERPGVSLGLQQAGQILFPSSSASLSGHPQLSTQMAAAPPGCRPPACPSQLKEGALPQPACLTLAGLGHAPSRGRSLSSGAGPSLTTGAGVMEAMHGSVGMGTAPRRAGRGRPALRVDGVGGPAPLEGAGERALPSLPVVTIFAEEELGAAGTRQGLPGP